MTIDEFIDEHFPWADAWVYKHLNVVDGMKEQIIAVELGWTDRPITFKS